MPNEDTATPETKLTAMCERTIQQLDELSEKLAPIIRGSRRLAVQARRISRVDGGGCCGTLATRW
jgi:hypothetical protein